jgi:hypothetical protein
VRAAFFLLLLTNLAYLAWAQWIDVPQRPAANDVYAKLPRLKLVSETSEHTQQPASGGARRTALQQPEQAAQCLSVGPFYDETGAARGVSVLHDKGLAPRQRSEQGEIPKGFWVFIGGLKTERDVAQVVRLLQQSHVDDARPMPDEGDARRVSVGIFSDRERADRRAQSLEKLGLQPEVAERKVPGPVFWVDVDLPRGTIAPTAQDIAGEADKQATVAACPAGASPQTPPLPPAQDAATTTFRTKVAEGAPRVVP